jgi:RNA polymerase sigma-70 factor (ECF subfamily)
MDQARAAALYDEYGPFVFRRCLKLLRDPADAQDAAQEVFVRAMSHLDGLRFGSPLPWLYEIATRHCLNRLRDETRRSTARATSLPRPLPPDPASAHADRDLAAWIVQQFDETTALIALLHVVDGMTQEEVARAVRLSRRTVGVKLRVFLEEARRHAQVA